MSAAALMSGPDARSPPIFHHEQGIAREMMARLGADAVPVLCKLAEQASAVGDQHGAAMWRDIADRWRRCPEGGKDRKGCEGP